MADFYALFSCRPGKHKFWMLGLLNVTRLTVQGLGGSGRAVFSGVMELFARGGIVMALVPADLYINPTCFFIMHQVEKELAIRRRHMVKALQAV